MHAPRCREIRQRPDIHHATILNKFLAATKKLFQKPTSILFWMASAALCLCPGEAATTTSKLDAIFTPLANSRSPGLAVLVQKDGRTLFRKGFGVGNLRTLERIDANTNFRLASCTKQFTAMAIMLLVHDGKLRYDEKLAGMFPDFPGYGRDIAIRHLLTHTSGLPDYEDLMPPTWTASQQIHYDNVLALLKHQTDAKFPPGASWSYSNSAYVVLGLVVAKVSGMPFDQFLHTRIFEPLQMKNTMAYVSGKNSPPHRAYGHTKEKDAFVESDQSPTSATLGDGGIYSNLVDLQKWDTALRNNVLLSRAEMQPGLLAVTLADGSAPHWPAQPGDDNLDPGQPVSYGFGWFLDPYKGRARMWHFGATQGFRTVIQRFTKENLTVIILSNRTDLDPAALASRVADILAHQE
jgi:CubicO group peptidase (beta-lactamase class C family)